MAEWQRVSAFASTLLAPNPGPMTLDGTNSYVLRAESGPAVVVDPGPEDAGHLAALAGAGPIELILITHRHRDHTEGSETLHRLTGAPVRAPRAADCHGGDPLADGERIVVGALDIRVVATPGHSADSTCFHLPTDRAVGGDTPGDGSGSVLTGDTVLGRGTTVIGIPDGTMAQYLDSLERIAGLGPCLGLPAHGPMLPDLAGACGQYLAHRRGRLDEVRAALERIGEPAASASVTAVTDIVYGDVAPGVRIAAEHSVAAQLEYLRAADAESVR